ncbi:hypothetical protein P0E52_00435 [Enterococcus faecalis]|uniref:hypothetical protein n=1 Tax=Enterococcus TaxID=1350 RepID=UPI001927F0C5|nr:hypothetical protein [Enterococcus faecalis]MDN3112474.1 hypothetical protein [Enterococcus faecalis]HBC4463036.1 hypothetical protein [Enterococcus faecalis]
MEAIRRVGFLFFVLVIGIFLGTLGLRLAFMIVTPLFILWFMSWDEKRYTHTRKQQQARYVYRKFP